MGLPFTTRKATQADSESIFNLVYELAVFERAPNEVTNTIDAIQKHGWAGEDTCWEFGHQIGARSRLPSGAH